MAACGNTTSALTSSTSPFQLRLVIDTLAAECQLLQLHSSLATHIAGAHAVISWMESKRDCAISEMREIVEHLLDRDLDMDDQRQRRLALETYQRLAETDRLGSLVAAHQKAVSARADDLADADAMVSAAETALLAFKPRTADEAADRAEYLLSPDFLDPSDWDEADIRTFVGSTL